MDVSFPRDIFIGKDYSMKKLFFVCFYAVFCLLYASQHAYAAPATLTFEATPSLTLYHNNWDGSVSAWSRSDLDGANANPEYSTDFDTHMAADKTPTYFDGSPNIHSYFWGSVSLAPIYGRPNQMVSNGIYDEAAEALARMTFTVGDTEVYVYGGTSGWSTGGFGVSSTYEKSGAGPVNQVSAWTAANADADGNTDGRFLVAYESFYYADAYAGEEVLSYMIPTIMFDKASTVVSLDLTNAAYTALSVLFGDGFAEPFSAADGDYLGVTITGLDEFGGKIVDKTLDFYLADFRTAGSEWVLEDWATASLAFTDVHGLRFEMFTSDWSEWGPNTPFYFAMDNLVLDIAGMDGGSGVPEPATWLMLLAGCGWMVWRGRQEMSRM